MKKSNRINPVKNKAQISPSLAKSIVTELTHSFFVDGLLIESDLNLPKRAFFEKVRSIVMKSNLKMIVDYRETILLQATIFLKKKEYEYAKLFYATFFEHTLNGIIHHACTKRKIDEKSKTAILKSVDLYGKLTWLPLLLGHRRFNEKYLKIIKTLADDRNAFVHYKWKMDPEDANDDDLKQEEQFKPIKAAVKYIRQYESDLFYKKNRAKLSSKFKKGPEHKQPS